MLKSILSLSILIIFCLGKGLLAADVEYVGGSSDYWHNNNAWSTNAPPTANDRVIIDCSCTVFFNQSSPAFARSIWIGPDATLHLFANASLEVTPGISGGITLNGWISNYGTILIQNPNTTAFIGLEVGPEGFLNNQANLRIYNATHGIRNYGQVQNAGSIRVGANAYATNQSNGIVNFPGSSFINHSATGTEIRIFATQSYGFLSLPNATTINRGLLRIESSVVGRGIANQGNFNNTGNIQLRGGTTIGLSNEGSLTNSGLIYGYNSGSGTAIHNDFGDLVNNAGGLIKVWGFSYDVGLEVTGGTYELENHGTIDIFTGVSNSYNAVYFHTNSRFSNSGIFKVVTYADRALVFNGDLFDNDGGTVDLNAYGPNLGMSIRNFAEFRNRNCGTLRMEDRLEIYGTGMLVNQAWMELNIYTGPPIMYPGAYLQNSGVIHDAYGSLANLSFDNSQGVHVIPLTNIIYPGQPYYDPFGVGGVTNVSISSEISGGEPGNVMGTYEQSQNFFVMDPALFSYEKYYYAEFDIPGCGARTYSMYRDSPQPFAASRPASGGSISSSPHSVEAEQLSVFPNPAVGELNVVLPAQWQGMVEVQLRSVTGQTVLRQTYDGETSKITLNRPVNLPAGMYVLTARDAAGNQTDKKVIFGEQR